MSKFLGEDLEEAALAVPVEAQVEGSEPGRVGPGRRSAC